MQLTALFIGVGINLTVIALVYLHLNAKVKKKDSSNGITSEIRREVDEMIVELNQTTDRNIGIIEERIERISRAVDEADRRIRLLQKSTDTFTMKTGTYSSVRPQVQMQQEQKEKHEEEREIHEEDKQALSSNNMREEVEKMYHQGLTKEIIASKLGVTLGEVELMITLMEGKKR